MNKELMLDLETMGHVSNSVIVQIGACSFNRNTGEIYNTFLQNVDIDSCLNAGLKVTGGTINFWLQQDKKIIESVFSDTLPLPVTLSYLQNFINEEGCEIVWSHANFDPVLLDNAYRACDRFYPFKYYNIRDLRTVVDLANLDLRSYEKIDAHNALADCKFQVKYLVDGLKILKGENN